VAMITVAIPTGGRETIGVLAESITSHLAIHPALVIECGGATEYDQSAVELTHIPSGAMICQISDPLTLRFGAVRVFAQWLETVCSLGELGHGAVPNGFPRHVRLEIRRFADAPNHWRVPRCSDACTTTAAAPCECTMDASVRRRIAVR
jgi:hypothetical protein